MLLVSVCYGGQFAAKRLKFGGFFRVFRTIYYKPFRPAGLVPGFFNNAGKRRKIVVNFPVYLMVNLRPVVVYFFLKFGFKYRCCDIPPVFTSCSKILFIKGLSTKIR